MKLSFSSDILAEGRATFTDIVGRTLIAEGGRWFGKRTSPREVLPATSLVHRDEGGQGFHIRSGLPHLSLVKCSNKILIIRMTRLFLISKASSRLRV
jgi:hypothetical protein